MNSAVTSLLHAEHFATMIRKINTGEFELTTEMDAEGILYSFNDARFNILKFRKRKIEKAPKGFSIKIEQQWRNGRVKSECLPFENFRDKYLKEHAPIFLEGGATLCFVLGLHKNDTFIPIKLETGETVVSLPVRPPGPKIKNFKIRLYYDLYIS